jgi:hypothetical protein
MQNDIERKTRMPQQNTQIFKYFRPGEPAPATPDQVATCGVFENENVPRREEVCKTLRSDSCKRLAHTVTIPNNSPL